MLCEKRLNASANNVDPGHIMCKLSFGPNYVFHQFCVCQRTILANDSVFFFFFSFFFFFFFQSFPKRQIFDSFKLKEFADKNFKFD